jgi:L-rhamnose mutarotase
MVKRMAMVIGLKPEKISEYKALHASPWPKMNAALAAAHIGNYSIFLKEPENLLFGYWEYAGDDFETDMATLGAKDITKRWLALTDPCQQPLASAGKGEWWSFMESVFHLD